ncbi:MAG: DUF805 domain-containing protein [Corallococcus sp.]|nr:DUF805 domain-containing protein [Corallococcus sp.]MCM1360008.1 DUF805 domain-containing protein [Corallococcus sp.]MCM1395565.1 DUF805 domain-containing protein [Corallococcus sp.]
MTMQNAFKLFFTRAFDFDGRSSRKEFWLGVLPNAVIMLMLIGLLLYSLLGVDPAINLFSIVMISVFALFCLVELIPSVSLIFRRMHDVGKSGLYILVLFIPVAGLVWYIYLVTRKTDSFVGAETN